MIKIGGTTKDGRKFVLLALSDGNIRRLREKKLIIVHAEEINADTDIWIYWGETEDDLAKELKGMISEHTRVRDHRTEKKN